MQLNKNYWQSRYEKGETGWDIGRISKPIKGIIDRIENKDARILIPGAGNGFEASYLFNKGFTNTFILDMAPHPLQAFEALNPSFPKSQILMMNFFDLDAEFDIIIEQTFFCALDPVLRPKYVQQTHDLLDESGILTGVLFDHPMHIDHPPFGGSRDEYVGLFSNHYHLDQLQPCETSEEGRMGKELILSFERR